MMDCRMSFSCAAAPLEARDAFRGSAHTHDAQTATKDTSMMRIWKSAAKFTHVRTRRKKLSENHPPTMDGWFYLLSPLP